VKSSTSSYLCQPARRSKREQVGTGLSPEHIVEAQARFAAQPLDGQPPGTDVDQGLPWLLRPAEAAKLLGLSRSRVYELIACGELPSLTIGASRRIRRDELWAWLGEQS
jgi:excisionase family DNA binding protein